MGAGLGLHKKGTRAFLSETTGRAARRDSHAPVMVFWWLETVVKALAATMSQHLR